MSLGKVLVIEHDEISRFLLQRVMDRKGCAGQLTYARHGREALGLIGREAFDLILLEINSPYMEGAEFLQALHRLPVSMGSALPKVVVLTTLSQPTFLASQHPLVRGFLSKPFRDEHADFLLGLRELQVENR